MPIYEYENKDTPGDSQGEKVIIEINSIQRELEDTSLFALPILPAEIDVVVSETSDEEICLEASQDSAETIGQYVIVSEGRLSREDGMLQLSYLEQLDEKENTPPVQVSLTFPPGEKGPVAISRTGAIRTAFTIEEGARQYSVYDTSYGKMDMCVIGRKIENKIHSGGGILRLDYLVELRGMIAQRTKMTIRVRPEHA
ncbi:MAG: DUF1934 domain-containing protein [Clostridiales bacterium]|nr:DUF1934 domain-containing protein [Clostridiales bacterium]